MDNITKLLEEEIEEQINNLSGISDPKQKSMAVEDLTKLYKLRIEQAKNEAELAEKQARREMEARQIKLDSEAKERSENLEEFRLSEMVRDRYFRTGIAVLEIGLPLMFYGVWMRRGFKLEKDGTYTSKTFMNLFNRFKPTRK